MGYERLLLDINQLKKQAKETNRSDTIFHNNLTRNHSVADFKEYIFERIKV